MVLKNSLAVVILYRGETRRKIYILQNFINYKNKYFIMGWRKTNNKIHRHITLDVMRMLGAATNLQVVGYLHLLHRASVGKFLYLQVTTA